MNIFISWSGERSKSLGAALKEWLPLIIQTAVPWFSDEDIDKGSRWLAELNSQLELDSIALLCITPESLNSPWLLFEAGAASKSLANSSVCPLLLGVEPTDIKGPLSQFQATKTTKDDMRRLLTTINRKSAKLSDARLNTTFEALWPSFESQLQAIPSNASSSHAISRSTPDLLEEVLLRVRTIERNTSGLAALGRDVYTPIPHAERTPAETMTVKALESWAHQEDLRNRLAKLDEQASEIRQDAEAASRRSAELSRLRARIAQSRSTRTSNNPDPESNIG